MSRKRSRDDDDDDGGRRESGGGGSASDGASEKHRPVCNQLRFDSRSLTLVSRPVHSLKPAEPPSVLECSGCLLPRPECDFERCGKCGVEICSSCSVRREEVICLDCMR